jgi:hypothetical protein
MKESAVSEKKAGGVSAQRAKKAASLTRDGRGAAEQPLMSIMHGAGCRDCGPSVQSLAGGMMQTPVAQRQAVAMSLQRARGNRFVQGMARQAKREPNHTGMPDRLKAGIESLSGLDMSDLRVHYNSEKPARLGALAYAQWNEIHLGPGQERHLPHEAWHVVQQKQGRVRATIHVNGVAVNDDSRLEREPDAIWGNYTKPHRKMGPSLSYSKQVLQARLPNMSPDDISQNMEITRELLLHSVSLLSETKFKEKFGIVMKRPHKKSATREKQNSLKLEIMEQIEVADANYLRFLYSIIEGKIGDRYQPEPIEAIQIPKDTEGKIISNFQIIINLIEKMKNQRNMLEKVFGTKDLEKNVFRVIDAVLKKLKSCSEEKTCPVKLAPLEKHNAWIGVGGKANYAAGATSIELSNKFIEGLAKSEKKAFAALFHELTHTEGNTQDHAYGGKAGKHLKPDKRVVNATTYEHAFLESAEIQDDNHYYEELKERSPRDFAVNVASLATEVWNFLDNAYLALQKILNLKYKDEINSWIKYFIKPAANPYIKDNETLQNRPRNHLISAIIEDRTKLVYQFRNAAHIRKIIKNEPSRIAPQNSQKEISHETAIFLQNVLEHKSGIKAEIWAFIIAMMHRVREIAKT